MNKGRLLHVIYKKLLSHFGPQHWWPGETPFEVSIGAILTQNTNWTNAASAISNLKRQQLLTPSRLSQISTRRLARLIRPSGYFNQKARRLKIFVGYLQKNYGGNLRRVRRKGFQDLRQELLALSGIGPETADSIVLYALEKPVFVVDAYTRRVLARHSLMPWDSSYEQIQELFMKNLPPNVPDFNEYHALFVAVGKELCRTHPKCHRCPLRSVGRLRLETTPAPEGS